jgi:DNA-binding response OmpR family regulator
MVFRGEDSLVDARLCASKRSKLVNTQTRALRILCVDDDVHVLAMLADTMRAAGHEVQTALDGAHALQKIATTEKRYNLIIADSRMPHLDGWRLIMQARAGGFQGRIILFSAWLNEEERARYRELNIDRVIEKPPKPGELLQAVRELGSLAA